MPYEPYETFTGSARKAMRFANWEAQRFNHEYIGAEHLLLGLLRVKSGIACGALNDMGTDPDKIYAEIEKVVRPGPDIFVIGLLPQSRRTKKAIENALEEARSLMSGRVGTGHLLLGLLRERESFVAHALIDAGLDPAEVRSAVLECMKKQNEPDYDFSDSGRSDREKTSQSGAESNQSAPGGKQADQTVSRKETEQTIPVTWKEFRQNPEDETLRNRLVEHYMPLVGYHADRLCSKLSPEIERDELISAGTFGLMDAIHAFDPDRGVKFETFCIPCIRGAMLEGIRKTDWVPRPVSSRFRILDESFRFLEKKFGRRPTEEELAEFLEMPVGEVREMIAQFSREKEELSGEQVQQSFAKGRKGSGMSDKTVSSLWKLYKQNPEDETLRDSLADHYMPVVRRRVDIIIEAAERYGGSGKTKAEGVPEYPLKIERETLVSAARSCLIDLISEFDPGRNSGIDFEAYIVPYIHYAVIRELRPSVNGGAEGESAPAALRNRTSKLKRNERLIFILYHFEKRKTKEIGYLLGLSEARICAMLSDIHHRLNLDWPPFQFEE